MGPYARSRAVTPSTVPSAPGGPRSRPAAACTRVRRPLDQRSGDSDSTSATASCGRAVASVTATITPSGIESGAPRGCAPPPRSRRRRWRARQHAAACPTGRACGPPRARRRSRRPSPRGAGTRSPRTRARRCRSIADAAHELVPERDRHDQLDRVGDRCARPSTARRRKRVERLELVAWPPGHTRHTSSAGNTIATGWPTSCAASSAIRSKPSPVSAASTIRW